jgi:hypothetical protein
MSTGPISFQNDIMPLFKRFQAPMAWRFDLTNYDTVKANAQLILGRINGGGMPPPPLTPLTQDQINMFEQWIAGGFQP